MSDKKYLFGLDLIRFAAALGVAFFHVGFSCWASPTSGAKGVLGGAYEMPEIAHLTWFWWMGVDTFFVLSGFVIANSAAGATPREFIKGRILRLFPAVWICAPVTCVLKMALDLRSDAFLAKTLASTAMLFPPGPWIDGQYWTLGVEIVFYALVFGLLAFGRWRNISTLAVVLALGSTLYQVLLTLDSAGVVQLPWLEALGSGRNRLLLLGYGCYFALGVLIWLWSVRRLDFLGWVAAAVALGGGVLQIRHSATGMTERIAVIDTAALWYVPVAVWVLSCAGIVLSVHWRPTLSRGWQKAIRCLGLMTYPLYLIHFSLGVWLTVQLVRLGVRPPVALLGVIAFLTGVSFAISMWIEPAVRRVLRMVLEAGERRFFSPEKGTVEPRAVQSVTSR